MRRSARKFLAASSLIGGVLSVDAAPRIAMAASSFSVTPSPTNSYMNWQLSHQATNSTKPVPVPKPITIHTFKGGKTDGVTPGSRLTQDAKGNIYGTAYSGGKYNEGILFELTPDATEKTGWRLIVRHDFGGTLSNKTKDGTGPVGGLLKDKAGNFYGLTVNNQEVNNPAYVDVIFEFTPSTGAYEVLYRNPVKSNLLGELTLDYINNVPTLLFTTASLVSSPSTVVSLQNLKGKWNPKTVYTLPRGGSQVDGLATDNSGNAYFVRDNPNSIASQLFKLTPPAWTATELLSFPTKGFIFEQSGYPVVSPTGDIYGLDQGTQSLWKASPPTKKGAPYSFTEPVSFQSIRTNGVWSLIPGQDNELYAEVGYDGDGEGGVERIDPPTSVQKTWKISTAIAATSGVHWVPSFIAKSTMYGTTATSVFKLADPQ